MHSFRKAVENRDERAIAALLADDVVFTSPVAFKPYAGKPITAAILTGVLRVFENFRYVREFHDGDNHALEFETGVVGAPDVTINGCDFIHVNADGLIDDFKVMVRPLSGAKALSEAMAAQFPRIQQEAVELADQFARA
jgi:SnoaL-like domain